MATPENKLSLKVLVDSKTNKVLFAEAGSDFVDVLFGFLTLPVGTIIRQLEKHFDKQTNSLGCLNNLYGSVRNLSSSSFSTEECKLMLLHPENASGIECQKLKLKIDDSEPTKYYRCEKFTNDNWKNGFPFNYCENRALSTYKKVRCKCGFFMNVSRIVTTQNQVRSSNGVFTYATKAFIITDDLRVMPTVKSLDFELIRNLVNGADVVEEQIIYVGLKEIMQLLKFSLISSTPMTNLLHQLNSGHPTIIKPEPEFVAHSQQYREDVKTECSIKLKALVQKSTSKLLLFLAGDDFIELLFTILTIPLGSVVSLLDGSSSIGSVDNLYKSISELGSCFLSSSIKALLTNPKLPPHYLSKKTNQLLPVSEKISPFGDLLVDPKCDQGYIKGQEAFMVTDDLVVTPLSSISIMVYLSTRNVPCYDVEELEFEIGTKEALDILRASLTSTDSALSSALKFIMKQLKQKLFIWKQPKQEK